MAAKQVFIVGAKRTAFGGFGGSLKHLTATDLAAVASSAALKAGNVDASKVKSVIMGNVAQTSTMAPYLARHASLMAGVPIETPALTVNRLCGSGFQSIVNGAHEILLGEADVVLTAGTESMSQSPFVARNIRWGTKLGVDVKLEDSLWATLTDGYIKTPMGITAENLAEKYGISRQDVDAYALQTQQRWGAANEAGHFDAEIEGIEVKTRKGKDIFQVDEHPRPQTTPEQLAKLPPVFIPDTGVTTAGNASGISDGAAALVLASGEAVEKYGLKPLARVVSWHYAGVDPKIMGIGPAPAIRGALEKAGLTLNDMELVEVNEAFGAQYLAVEKELGLDRERTNVCGGAIALGHPLAASGARIMTHLTHRMQARENRKSDFAVGSACIGGGQGIAIIIERQ